MENKTVTERRHAPRSRCLKGARILMSNGNSTLACRIHDQSGGGVRLKADEVPFVPNSFTLVPDGATEASLCEISWRHNGELGARVVSDTAIKRIGLNHSKPLMRMRKNIAMDRYPV